MNLPIYNCLIDDDDNDVTGICAISFVDCPANEVDFVALKKQQEQLYLNRDARKQILTGVVLKPEQLIFRHSEELGDYYIKFSAEQIEKIAQKMMRTGVALYNTTHQHQSVLKGNFLTELWIVEDPQTDKSKALGFENLPKGTLMCSYKVEDKAYWDKEVMTGHVKGFSLEGFFNQQPDKLNIKNQVNQKCKKMNKKKPKQTLLGRIAHMLLDIEAVEKADTTSSGVPYVVFVLADGKEAYVDEDGFATLDGEQMPAGEHKLANGNLLVIDEQGQFTETREPSEDKTKPEDAKAPQTLKRSKAKLAQFEPKTADALKAKIAEMQQTIDSLTQSLTDAQSLLEDTKGQIEEMRKKTPSAQPAMQRQGTTKKMNEMTTAERMAVALNQTVNRRK
ncbi:putative coiled-coil protein SlyX [Dysgonomonas sp. PFB1-18]|uniref:XkdF-like putative serine protease domain-containing protein n=1 Tax=unclassified Dysgonomonas TaxID=2630389 RepID=UPI002474BB98|nr:MULTISPECIES: XkdF-like putative serine protease domain-containing protein [unclassified Dysgonomonas]MDH6311149.1 putative coiled-coil protein SlyX [Dysgonomonas sp. PF1-14]MDH6340003.1 putative coiled-coil protein SlyX [Dysgonomonas sp. PF1-16]MDH6382701.1 putative coiled-coil protein SlyX [Dysgonomonas sp. PFB1-18]MDH6398868.1 putative coiled-coil protein SlyX [Dysgonomonas sp. PF1-23]